MLRPTTRTSLMAKSFSKVCLFLKVRQLLKANLSSMLLKPSFPFSFLSFIFVICTNNFKIMKCLVLGFMYLTFIPHQVC